MERTMIVGNDLADEVKGFGWGVWGVCAHILSQLE